MIRERAIKFLLPDNATGDLGEYVFCNRYQISCVLVFFKNINLIRHILLCLKSQKFHKEHFEIIIVEDRGGSPEGKSILNEFPEMNISYYSPDTGWGLMGYMRNFGLSKCKGEIVLFLDDDTVILDRLFLKKLYEFFKEDPELMAVIPKGNPLFCLIKEHYCYHDPYFFTNRCMAYRRSCLIEMRGFDSSFIGQEDVEFAIRFLAKGYKYIKTDKIQYYHPPFVVKDLKKPQAVGYSFTRSKYPFYLKLIFCINGARWLYRIIYPCAKNRNMAKFAFGFVLGFIKGLLGKKPPLYII